MSLLTLKQQFTYDNFLVLGCGPSLNDFTEYQIDKINGNVGSGLGMRTIAIKQALFHYPNADIHVMNTCNISDYSKIFESKTADDNFHSIFQIAYPEMPYYDISNYDTILPIGQNHDYSKSLAITHDIERWSFDNSPFIRCWGPSLMFETVFYLCHYLGAKNIYTIGWDGANNNDTRSHFYNDDIKIFNKARPLEKMETQKEIELSGIFYKWLQSKGINLYIASKNSYYSGLIPRISI